LNDNQHQSTKIVLSRYLPGCIDEINDEGRDAQNKHEYHLAVENNNKLLFSFIFRASKPIEKKFSFLKES
jgi:hypothetical protein